MGQLCTDLLYGERRVTCNTCGRAKPAGKAKPTASAAADSVAGLHGTTLSSTDAAASASPEGTAKECIVGANEQRGAVPVAVQPGFVDFAALSRRILGSSTVASDIQTLAGSRTYEAAAAAMPTAAIVRSTAQTVSSEANTFAAAITQSQLPESRTYEAARVLPESDGGATPGARQQTTAAGCSRVRSTTVARQSPPPPRALINGLAVEHVNAVIVPVHKLQRTAKPQQQRTEDSPATQPRDRAAASQHPTTSEDDNCATDTDTDVLRGPRSRQQTATIPVSWRQPHVAATRNCGQRIKSIACHSSQPHAMPVVATCSGNARCAVLCFVRLRACDERLGPMRRVGSLLNGCPRRR